MEEALPLIKQNLFIQHVMAMTTLRQYLRLSPLELMTKVKNPTGQAFSLSCTGVTYSASENPRPEDVVLYHPDGGFSMKNQLCSWLAHT